MQDTYRPDLARAEQAAGWEERERLLTSARLYATQGEAAAARGLYAEVLGLESDWPAALDSDRWYLIDQGDLAVTRGSLADAQRDFGEALARAERLLALDPAGAGREVEALLEADPDNAQRAPRSSSSLRSRQSCGVQATPSSAASAAFRRGT